MRPNRLFATALAAAAITLGAAACGSSTTNRTPSPAATQPAATTAAAQPTATGPAQTAMPLQAGAQSMKVSITSPANGTKITGNSVTLDVAHSGYTFSCDLAGKPVQAGEGHYHVLIDKSLVDMECTPQAVVSMQNVKPGTHTLTVVPAQDDHAEISANAVNVTIDYEPASPLPQITDVSPLGKPSITIVSPKPGDTVSGNFDVVVAVKNFNLSCDLYGKPDVAGYGHWHLNLDSTSGPMMGMGTMAGMSCLTTFHASTAGLKAGSTHTLIATLMGNGHAPLEPLVNAQVEVKVK